MMERREFLRTAALTAAGAAVLAQFGGVLDATTASASTTGTRYKGTKDGKVLVSTDAGHTWKVHSNFGSEFVVKRVTVKQGKVTSHLTFNGRAFDLALDANGKTWRSN